MYRKGWFKKGMIKVLISGINGKMGGNILELLQSDKEAFALCGVDIAAGNRGNVPVYANFSDVTEKPDVIIDFSSPAILKNELAYCVKNIVPLVLGSTGFTAEDIAEVDKASKEVAIFRTGNFSLGINLLVKLVNEAATFLGEKFDIEIIEKHHNLKKDAPSGTALMLAESANAAFDHSKPTVNGRSGIVGPRGNEIGIHAVRGGTIVGEHEVDFCGEDEIITLSHSARSKKVFAAGAITAAKFLAGKPAGKYNMNDILNTLSV
jgi:4-hydroxy-tetrahydrodipicolinate reductase